MSVRGEAKGGTMAFRIISFDGGGTRGLYTAVILERLCAEVPELLDKADLLAGTSTGGLICLSLASGRKPADLVALYRDRARDMFDDTWYDDVKDVGKLIGADYDNKRLKAVLEEIVGPATLGQLSKKVLVPTFCLDNRKDGNRRWNPKFFHNLEGEDSDQGERASDVALRTSAAPSYFPTYQGFVDGGVVANNPSMAAVALALDPRSGRQRLDDVVLLSLGTGAVPNFIDSAAAEGSLDWGLAQWAKPLITIMIEGVMGVADFQCQQLLRDRYHRVNGLLPRDLALDDVNHQAELIEWAGAVPIEATVDWLRNVFIGGAPRVVDASRPTRPLAAVAPSGA
jgi:patatin-like phospholipase/acyl hydrolase